MKIFSAAAKVLQRGAEGFPGLVPSTSQAWATFTTPGSSFDWKQYTGKTYDSAPVAIGLSWITRNFPYARIMVQERKDTKWIEADDDLTGSLLDPNPFYDASSLWAASALSDSVGGNCYWAEARRINGKIAFVYLPHTLITPVTDGGTWIDYYQFRQPGREAVPLDPDRILHFRNGLDPQDMRLGLSPLGALFREVAGDNLASTYNAAIMRRMGVPGAIIAPKEKGVDPTPAQVAKIKELYKDNLTLDGAGGLMVAPQPMDVTFPGASPEKLAISSLRDVPAGRILAAMGLNAGALDMPSDTSKHHANYQAMVEACWDQCLKPLQIRFARTLTARYFPGNPDRRVWWDWSEVPAFADDEEQVAKIAGDLFQRGVNKRSESRSMVGLDSTPEDEVYVESISLGGDPTLKALAKAAGERASRRRQVLEDAGLAPGDPDA